MAHSSTLTSSHRYPLLDGTNNMLLYTPEESISASQSFDGNGWNWNIPYRATELVTSY